MASAVLCHKFWESSGLPSLFNFCSQWYEKFLNVSQPTVKSPWRTENPSFLPLPSVLLSPSSCVEIACSGEMFYCHFPQMDISWSIKASTVSWTPPAVKILNLLFSVQSSLFSNTEQLLRALCWALGYKNWVTNGVCPSVYWGRKRINPKISMTDAITEVWPKCSWNKGVTNSIVVSKKASQKRWIWVPEV